MPKRASAIILFPDDTVSFNWTSDLSVNVEGVCLYETEDDLVARAVAHCYKEIGWKRVEVKGKNHETR